MRRPNSKPLRRPGPKGRRAPGRTPSDNVTQLVPPRRRKRRERKQAQREKQQGKASILDFDAGRRERPVPTLVGYQDASEPGGIGALVAPTAARPEPTVTAGLVDDWASSDDRLMGEDAWTYESPYGVSDRADIDYPSALQRWGPLGVGAAILLGLLYFATSKG